MRTTLSRRGLLGVAFALPVLPALAAVSTDAGEAPTDRVVDHVFTESGAKIVVPAGKLFFIALDANPSTGYHWVTSKDADIAVAAWRGSSFMAAATALVGAPGTTILVFEATGAGSTSVVLAYMPPGRGGKPGKSATFDITVTPADAR